jgi:hypothetical protein
MSLTRKALKTVQPMAYIADRVYTIRRELELLRCAIAGLLQSKEGVAVPMDIDENVDARDALAWSLTERFDRVRTALNEIDECVDQTFELPPADGQVVKRLHALCRPQADTVPEGDNEPA